MARLSVDEAGLQASYDRHREAYISLFDRLGLPYVIVSAMSGAMGGSASEEFLTPLDVGEDTGTPISEDYGVPFKFTGELEKVTIKITEHHLTEEQLQQYREAQVKAAFSR